MTGPANEADVRLADTLMDILVRHHPDFMRRSANDVLHDFDIAQALAKKQLGVPVDVPVPAHRWNLWLLATFAYLDIMQRRIANN